MGFFRDQYKDIKGHMKWALLVGPIYTAGVWATSRLLKMIPNIPLWLVYAIVLVASFVVFTWLIGQLRSNPQLTSQNSVSTLATTASKFETQMRFSPKPIPVPLRMKLVATYRPQCYLGTRTRKREKISTLGS